ncbi:MAG: ketopantoate reductase family protein [Deltaproteobacteria bacterium]|nr:ketopantoate reductase family protein [Deltaproteobacteria bacterium]
MQKQIAIVGAGPVGSILAANFATASCDALVVEVAPKRCQQILAGGLVIEGKQSLSVRPAAVLGSIAELQDRRPEAVFICTKTWMLRSILPQLAEVLRPETLVINFQNGIGAEDESAAVFPRQQVGRGIVNYAGGLSPETGTVTMHWFTPPIHLGALEASSQDRFEQIAAILSGVGLTTQAVDADEIKKKAFYKAILNSALNALCANVGITMQQAMTYPQTRSLASLLIREGLSVAAAVGYNYGEDAHEVCLRYLDEGGNHLPSMWADLQRGTLTEIESINGKIAKIGSMFENVSVDLNLFFTALIVTQEIKSGARRADDIPSYLLRE